MVFIKKNLIRKNHLRKIIKPFARIYSNGMRVRTRASSKMQTHIKRFALAREELEWVFLINGTDIHTHTQNVYYKLANSRIYAANVRRFFSHRYRQWRMHVYIDACCVCLFMQIEYNTSDTRRRRPPSHEAPRIYDPYGARSTHCRVSILTKNMYIFWRAWVGGIGVVAEPLPAYTVMGNMCVCILSANWNRTTRQNAPIYIETRMTPRGYHIPSDSVCTHAT